MLRYLLLNLVFLSVLAAVLYALRQYIHWRTDLTVLAALLLLTAIFDNLIIMAGIVAYDPQYLSGIYIGKAPIEDFAYAVAAALGLPPLWRKLSAAS